MRLTKSKLREIINQVMFEDDNGSSDPVKLKTDLVDSNNNKKVLQKGSKINFIIAKKLFTLLLPAMLLIMLHMTIYL